MTREEARQKAIALVNQMTIEEAAGQLRFDAQSVERLNVPEYNWWNEALHGVARAGMATSFPQAIGMAESFDAPLVEKVADIISTEARAKYNAQIAHGDRDIYKGLTFWSPNVNIFRDPRWGRGHETYGEDPYLTAEIGKAFVRGLQGDGETMKAAACAKHFAVHSGPEADRHHFNAVVNDKDLNETYLPAFKSLVTEAKVEAVMGAYNRTNGEPCCGNTVLIQKYLRGKWNFQGHFVSDCWAVKDFHTGHMVTKTPKESCALALKTGCDVNCGCTYTYVLSALKQGLIEEHHIRDAAVRLMTTRFMLGLFDGSEYDSIPYSVVECPEHINAALRMARESCVLLKNDGALPLDIENIKTLGVIGPNADSRSALIGNYHGTSSRYVTVQEALQDALEGRVRVLAAVGSDLCHDKVEDLAHDGDRLSEAVTVAENSDAVVLVVGLDETLEGEEGDASNFCASGDKLDLLLPEAQRKLIDAVLAVGKPTTIVLMAGSAVDLGAYTDKAGAVLLAWYPGARGGRAVADILLGKVSPSGKLPVTFYHNDSLSRMPAFTDYSMRGRTYKFLDEAPLYPFGYGLTYGDVAAKTAKVERDGEDFIVTATFENTGKVSTDEVAQVYVQNEQSLNAPKHPRLGAFKRFTIGAGETVCVTLTLKHAQTQVVNDAGEYIDEGSLVFCVGLGQPDARTQALTGHESIAIKV